MSDDRDFNKPFKLGFNKPPISDDGKYLRVDSRAYVFCKDERVDEVIDVLYDLLMMHHYDGEYTFQIEALASRLKAIKNPTSGDQSE